MLCFFAFGDGAIVVDRNCCRGHAPAVKPETAGDATPAIGAFELAHIVLGFFSGLEGLDAADFAEDGAVGMDEYTILLDMGADNTTLVVSNGEKIWISGAGDPRCKIMIVMCIWNFDLKGPFEFRFNSSV